MRARARVCMPEVEIAKRDDYKHQINIDSPNTVIRWSFSTIKKNIGFGLFYKATGLMGLDEGIAESFKSLRVEDLKITPSGFHKKKKNVLNKFRRSTLYAADDEASSEDQLTRNNSIKKDKSDPEYFEVLPLCRYESYKYNVTGYIKAPVSGTYILWFDNTFSFNTSKKLSYTVSVDGTSKSILFIGPRPQSMNALNNTITGWLLIRKHRKLHGWDKKYCRLSGSVLNYSFNPEAPTSGDINLVTASVSRISERLLIIIDTGALLHHIRALNEEDYMKWTSAIGSIRSSNLLTSHSSFQGKNSPLSVIYQNLLEIEALNQSLCTAPSNDLRNDLTKAISKTVKFVAASLLGSQGNLQAHGTDAVSIKSNSSDVFYDATDIVLEADSDYSDYHAGDTEDDSSGDELVEKKPIKALTVAVENRRSRLPCNMEPVNISFASILRKSIGKELGSLPMPIRLNEPLGLLQHLCEELEYCSLLEKAAASTNSLQRIALVTAFAVSGYARTACRERKPFNPLLGETFECIREDYGFKFIAEKVSHKPVILACHVTGKSFSLWQDQRPKTKFWGKSIEIFNNGDVHLILKTTGEHFTWNKVTSCMRNVLSGKSYIEHYGQLVLKNHTNNDTSVINFKGNGLLSNSRNEVHGFATSGTETVSMRGIWNEVLFTENEDGKSDVLWKSNPYPEKYQEQYGFTRFAIELNEITNDLANWLPSTDTRKRPDQRMYEEGKLDESELVKAELEEAQRERRKKEETEEHSPQWFSLLPDPITGQDAYVFNEKYWACREAKKWPSLVNLW